MTQVIGLGISSIETLVLKKNNTQRWWARIEFSWVLLSKIKKQLMEQS